MNLAHTIQCGVNSSTFKISRTLLVSQFHPINRFIDFKVESKRLPGNFEKALEDERMTKEATEMKIATLEVEREVWSRSEGKWRWELEMRENIIQGLQGHRTKQSTTIIKLKEEISHYKHEIIKWDGQIKYLVEEVESEKHARLDAQECTHLIA
ncbi:uncharacterized protein A4U43_C01F20420 [Asparagus officinalis]|uniref:Uncharacterized protein n=1 Tax=Asparagus officinalis TaxID=4686 RepID=A0A5P1FVB7_ASPOF|nr:uncharacterized protein A4U43_C01F20420 [Asparagus officinalis]